MTATKMMIKDANLIARMHLTDGSVLEVLLMDQIFAHLNAEMGRNF